jgi:hypothetical protein
MISAVLILLAAMCNAVMDRIDDENIHDSIWKNSNWEWWYKRESWDNAKRIFGWKFDGWHVFKSLMLFFLVAAIVLYKPMFVWFDFTWLNRLCDFSILGFIWIGSFNVGYNHLFKR